MEHEFIIDLSVYYEAGKYEDIDDLIWYKCKNCGVGGDKNEVGDVVVMWPLETLTCEEQIIKNIIE